MSAPPVFPLGNGPHVAYVTSLYQVLLGRAPDASAAGWVTALDQGDAPSSVAAGIIASPEYRQNLIAALYQTYLGRDADPAGLAYWSQQMEYGMTRDAIITWFLGSAEGYAKWS